MRIRNIAVGLTAASLMGAGLVYTTLPASAAVPPPVAGNITMLASAPRLVPSPGSSFEAGQTLTFQVGGQKGVPANATGVVLSITATNPTVDGNLTAWTTDAGKPGTPTVSYVGGKQATNVATVALNDSGKMNVFSSAKTRVLISVQAYTTPLAAAPAPVVKNIAPVARKAINVGGGFIARSEDMGEVTLPAGTYDARVLGSFRGLNNVNNTVPAGVTLTGTMAITLGDTVKPDFSNNITVGGIAIPRSQSDTLTQDPTASISTFFTLTESTDVHVRMFAYASNSSQAGSGELQAGLDSATFVRIS